MLNCSKFQVVRLRFSCPMSRLVSRLIANHCLVPFQRHDAKQDRAHLHKDRGAVGPGVPEMLGKVSFTKSSLRKLESDENISTRIAGADRSLSVVSCCKNVAPKKKKKKEREMQRVHSNSEAFATHKGTELRFPDSRSKEAKS